MTCPPPSQSAPPDDGRPIPPPRTRGSVVQLLLGTEGGGIITAIQQWAPLLIESGWTMHFILLAESKAAEMLRSTGFKTTVLHVSRLGRLTRLGSRLAPFNPSILHCHNPSSHLMAMAAARSLGARVVRTVHADMFHEMRGTQSAWKIWLWKQAMRRVLPRTDLLTVVSPHLIPLLPGIRGQETNLRVMANGFDANSIDAADSPLSPELSAWLGKSPLVLAMGRLVAVKNFAMLVRAWRRIIAAQPDAKLVLAGSGPQERLLRALVTELEMDSSVRLVGWIDSVAPYLKRADLVVLSSRSECCPMLVFEAMAARKPIVATSVGGVPFLVSNGEEGLLVPDDDADKLAESVVRVLNDASLAATMGRAGRATLERRFGDRLCARELAEAYNSLSNN